MYNVYIRVCVFTLFCLCMFLNVCISVCAWESCSMEPLPAAASSRCCLPASLYLLSASCHHHRRDQNRTMLVRQRPFSVPGPRGTGRPLTAELMKAILNSHGTKPCMSAVQSPAPSSCASVSKPSVDYGGWIMRECCSFQTIRRFDRQMSKTVVVRFVGKLFVFLLTQDASVLYTWSFVLLQGIGLYSKANPSAQVPTSVSVYSHNVMWCSYIVIITEEILSMRQHSDTSPHVHRHPCSVGSLRICGHHPLWCHPLDNKGLFSDLIGELFVCKMRNTQTQCHCPTTFTSTPTASLNFFTQTHT